MGYSLINHQFWGPPHEIPFKAHQTTLHSPFIQFSSIPPGEARGGAAPAALHLVRRAASQLRQCHRVFAAGGGPEVVEAVADLWHEGVAKNHRIYGEKHGSGRGEKMVDSRFGFLDTIKSS